MISNIFINIDFCIYSCVYLFIHLFLLIYHNIYIRIYALENERFLSILLVETCWYPMIFSAPP